MYIFYGWSTSYLQYPHLTQLLQLRQVWEPLVVTTLQVLNASSILSLQTKVVAFSSKFLKWPDLFCSSHCHSILQRGQKKLCSYPEKYMFYVGLYSCMYIFKNQLSRNTKKLTSAAFLSETLRYGNSLFFWSDKVDEHQILQECGQNSDQKSSLSRLKPLYYGTQLGQIPKE